LTGLGSRASNQWHRVPVVRVIATDCFSGGIEQVLQPALGFAVLTLLVKAVCHQPGKVEKQLDKVAAVGTVEIQCLRRFAALEWWFLQMLRGPAQQCVHAFFCALDQVPGEGDVHSDGAARLVCLGLAVLYFRVFEVDEFCCT